MRIEIPAPISGFNLKIFYINPQEINGKFFWENKEMLEFGNCLEIYQIIPVMFNIEEIVILRLMLQNCGYIFQKKSLAINLKCLLHFGNS